MPDDETLRFYAENAATYVAHSRQLPRHQLDAFLAALPPGGDILELGTGGGQDAAHMLARGFVVTPTDASPELAAEAEVRLGRPVKLMAFNQLEAVSVYDGVWACAALLHAPAAELTEDIARIHTALRPGGHFVASFKAGIGEGRDSLGRYYNYPSAEMLLTYFRVAAEWAALDLSERDGGGYDGLPTRWLWMRATKASA
jgi:SAM-dependent methyltransferase